MGILGISLFIIMVGFFISIIFLNLKTKGSIIMSTMKDLSNEDTQTLSVNSDPRVETGLVKFVYKNGHKDWTGVFIRGDNALYYAMLLEGLLEDSENVDPVTRVNLESLKNLLYCSREG